MPTGPFIARSLVWSPSWRDGRPDRLPEPELQTAEPLVGIYALVALSAHLDLALSDRAYQLHRFFEVRIRLSKRNPTEIGNRDIAEGPAAPICAPLPMA